MPARLHDPSADDVLHELTETLERSAIARMRTAGEHLATFAFSGDVRDLARDGWHSAALKPIRDAAAAGDLPFGPAWLRDAMRLPAHLKELTTEQREDLTLAIHRLLMQVADPVVRRDLADRAHRNGWSREQLREHMPSRRTVRAADAQRRRNASSRWRLLQRVDTSLDQQSEHDFCGTLLRCWVGSASADRALDMALELETWLRILRKALVAEQKRRSVQTTSNRPAATLTEADSTDDHDETTKTAAKTADLIATFAAEANACALDRMRDAGHLLAKHLTNGDVHLLATATCWSSAAMAPIRQAARDRQLPICERSLWYATKLPAHLEVIGEALAKALTLGHHKVLRHIADIGERRKLAQEAVDSSWSRADLQTRVNQDTWARGQLSQDGPGRYPMPGWLRGLEAAERLLEVDVDELVQALSARRLAGGLATVDRMLAAVERVREELPAALDRASKCRDEVRSPGDRSGAAAVGAVR